MGGSSAGFDQSWILRREHYRHPAQSMCDAHAHSVYRTQHPGIAGSPFADLDPWLDSIANVHDSDRLARPHDVDLDFRNPRISLHQPLQLTATNSEHVLVESSFLVEHDLVDGERPYV